MLASAIPTKIQLPFGAGAGSGYIRVVPVPSQIGINSGWASFTDGFPPLCFQPIGSGGIPPFGQDMNGVINVISAWCRWYAAGGPVQYDASFEANVSGYPQGAVVASTVTLGLFWFNVTDGNTTNPDASGAGWIGFSPTGSNARVITASGAFTTNASDQTIGLDRTASLANSTTTLPLSTSLVNGKTIDFEDLAGNFNTYPLIVTAPGGATIAGQTSFTFNRSYQCAQLRFYANSGTPIWSVRQ